MPNYTFIDKDEKEFTTFMSMSDCETFLKENPDLNIKVMPRSVVSGIDGLRKPDEGFRDILRTYKKRHPRGNINTWD